MSGLDRQAALDRGKDVLRTLGVRRAVNARRHRGLVPADAYVASFPRSGNTWLRFVLADLIQGRPVGFEEVERVLPTVGFHQDGVRLAGGGRVIKTHEAFRAEYQRGIYLVRDVRDVLISLYRILRDDPNDVSDMDTFVQRFAAGRAVPYGTWEDHVRGWLAAAETLPDMAVIRFEALRNDTPATVLAAAGALGIPATPETVALALSRNTSKDMLERERSEVGYLKGLGYRSQGVRDGSGGGWRELLAPRHLDMLAPALALNRELGYD